MSEMIQLDNLPVETLAEMANEAAAACEASGRKTVEHAATCGRALLAIRPQIPHGEWLSWLANNFSQSQSRASQYMSIANYYARNNLEAAETIQGALRMIADTPEKQAKKQEREAKKQERQPEKTEAPPKPLAPATPTLPVSVGTIRNENPPVTPAPPTALELTRQRLAVAQRMADAQKPAWLADPDELERPEEDDLPPLPKTNTHYTAQNRRTPDARETDRIGIVPPDDPRTYHDGHWYEWNEDRGRMVAVTDAEILRRADEIRGQSIVEHAKDTTPVVEHKQDSVSNKPGKVPTVTQLRSMVEQRADIGTHRHLWSEAMVKAVQEWASYKQSLAGKAKIRSMEQWGVALTRIENVVAAKGWPAVADMIEKAIANGWQGWEHETNDRKTRGMAGGRIYSQLEKAKVKYDPLPE